MKIEEIIQVVIRLIAFIAILYFQLMDRSRIISIILPVGEGCNDHQTLIRAGNDLTDSIVLECLGKLDVFDVDFLQENGNLVGRNLEGPVEDSSRGVGTGYSSRIL